MYGACPFKCPRGDESVSPDSSLVTFARSIFTTYETLIIMADSILKQRKVRSTDGTHR
jgi:hypothetical protein